MKRVLLVVAYEGTAYRGWQVQPNGITIESVLNEKLSELLGEEIGVIGAAGRIPASILWEMWLFLIPMPECRRIRFLMP